MQRQYIGARYVPKIYKNSQDPSSMEWENTEFEPFTIVSYLNNSFISRDQVPINAGNPTVATSHWALFGYASGQIAHLQDQIDDINDDLDVIDYRMSDIKNKKILFVSDSYGTPANSWANTLINDYGMSNCVNLAVSGTAFYDGSFLAQIQNYAGTRDDVDYILVAGGLNDSLASDSTAISTLMTAMDAFRTYVAANYPNAKMILSYIGIARDNSSVLSGRDNYNRQAIEDAYKNWAYYRGIHYLDVVDILKTNIAFLNTDGVHPSNNGSAILARAIFNALNFGYTPIYNAGSGKAIITPVTGVTVTGLSPLCKSIQGKTIRYAFNGQYGFNLQINATASGISAITAAAQKLFELDHYLNQEYVFPMQGRLDGTPAGSYINFGALLTFKENSVYIATSDVNSAHSAIESYTLDDSCSLILFPRVFDFNIRDFA